MSSSIRRCPGLFFALNPGRARAKWRIDSPSQMSRPLRKPPAHLRYAKERDHKREHLQRSLRQHEWLAQVPQQVFGGLAELILVSRELRARLQNEGVMRPRANGGREIHPAVEALRRYKLAELAYLQTISEIRHGEESSAIDLPAAFVESAADDESGTE
jgi:hypothetical protein